MDITSLHPVVEAIVALLLVIGGLFCLIGAIGFARFSDFFMRLHAPTKASTLGVGGLLVASVVWHWALGDWALRELLITVFLFITAPVSAHLISEAALHLRVPSRAAPPKEVQEE